MLRLRRASPNLRRRGGIHGSGSFPRRIYGRAEVGMPGLSLLGVRVAGGPRVSRLQVFAVCVLSALIFAVAAQPLSAALLPQPPSEPSPVGSAPPSGGAAPVGGAPPSTLPSTPGTSGTTVAPSAGDVPSPTTPGSPPQGCAVATLVGLHVSSARSKATASNCKMIVRGKVRSGKFRKGYVIRQSARAGTSLAAGAPIGVWVSLGAPKRR